MDLTAVRTQLKIYLQANATTVSNWGFMYRQPAIADGVVGDIAFSLFTFPDRQPLNYSELDPVIGVQLTATNTDVEQLRSDIEQAIAQVTELLDQYLGLNKTKPLLKPYSAWVLTLQGDTESPNTAAILYSLTATCSYQGIVQS